MKKVIIIIIAIVAVAGIYIYATYNSLVTLNVAADAQWKQVEAQYQRRLDLIPNLVESVKGIMNQEQTVFGSIAEARTKYSGAVTSDEKAAAASQVEGALGKLLAIIENYPELKSSDTVQTLMSQLEGTENRISVERMRFNQDVQAYNLKVLRVPSSMVASMFGFGERQYFNATAGAENAPKVQF